MIKHVVTRGFGNGTFAGEIARVVTRGYGIGEVSTVTIEGRWSDIERIQADRTRQAIHADRGRIEVRG